MKAIIPTHHSRAIERIGQALAQHAPASLEVARPCSITKESRGIEGEADADLVVFYCNGFRDRYAALAQRCLARGQRYAVVQIALRTTRHPNTKQWRDLWRQASLVWTYYPLDVWIREDGGKPIDFPFYHAPLGVDAGVFRPPARDGAWRPYVVCTSGARRNQESVEECDEAAAARGERILQLGPTFRMKADTTFVAGIDDRRLAGLYGLCRFVSGLRRCEGFELPAAEGLLCGARPLLYDQPHYRTWYREWGVFIRERGTTEVASALRRVFEAGPKPVSESERAAAARLFDWAASARGFWGGLNLA